MAAAIFELPFDVIIWTRIYPPVPPDPELYRFAPLVPLEVTTLSLLTLTPTARLSRTACCCLLVLP
jgi:hypothetical protein